MKARRDTRHLASGTRLIIATHNPGKLKEMRELLAPYGIEATSAEELRLEEPEETGMTFAENASIKAQAAAHASGLPAFADDSGLVVPSLDGRPGVQSARYAGPDATNAQKIEKLLYELQGKAGKERAANFVCVLSVVMQESLLAVITARVDGEILLSPRGAGGFGYDPIFLFPPLHKSFAELTAEEKNQHSHRGKAFRRLLSVLPGML